MWRICVVQKPIYNGGSPLSWRAAGQIGQFRYIEILTWTQGLGKYKNNNKKGNDYSSLNLETISFVYSPSFGAK